MCCIQRDSQYYGYGCFHHHAMNYPHLDDQIVLCRQNGKLIFISLPFGLKKQAKYDVCTNVYNFLDFIFF